MLFTHAPQYVAHGVRNSDGRPQSVAIAFAGKPPLTVPAAPAQTEIQLGISESSTTFEFQYRACPRRPDECKGPDGIVAVEPRQKQQKRQNNAIWERATSTCAPGTVSPRREGVCWFGRTANFPSRCWEAERPAIVRLPVPSTVCSVAPTFLG